MSGDVVPMTTWWDFVDDALDFRPRGGPRGRRAPSRPNLNHRGPRALGTLAGNVGGNLDDSWDVRAPVTEHRLYRWADVAGGGPAVIPATFALLALVATRVGSRQNELSFWDDWDICRDGGVSRLALSRFFNQWRDRQQLSLAEAARWLFGDYVIRHTSASR